MTGAELAARRTAAAAVLADFRTWAARDPRGPHSGPDLDWQDWSQRLAIAVDQLLEVTGDQAATLDVARAALLDAPAIADAEPAKLAAIRAVLDAFDWETGDRQHALEAIEQIAGASRTASGPELGGGAYLDRQDRRTVLGAIETAAAYLEGRAAVFCDDCETHPAGLCPDHDSDLDAAAQYRAVATRLEIDR